MLLFCGGSRDKDIQYLSAIAEQKAVEHTVLHTEESKNHQLVWNITKDEMLLNGQIIRPTGIYMRYSRFDDGEQRSESDLMVRSMWYHAIKDWAITHPEVRYFNKPYGNNHTDKIRNLAIAKECGFRIPETFVTNTHINNIGLDADDCVIKHIAADIPTKEANRFYAENSDARWIHLLQQRLTYPEVRIFVVGRSRIAFTINSNEVDYRYAAERTIEPIALPENLLPPLNRLCERIGLDWAAADFKTDPETGELLFLEINDQPMFAGFDARARGVIADAILYYLTENQR